MTEETHEEVLAVVAHRLLGSVAVIRGAAALLATPANAARHGELADLVVEEALLLEAIVRSMLRGDLSTSTL